MRKNLLGSVALCAACFVGPLSAGVVTIPQSALIPSSSYYTDTIGGGLGNVVMDRNDDGSSAAYNLGFSLTFFGNSYSQFWVNNNGNISFNGSISQYTPSGPQGATQPIISPFFADVDTRSLLSGLVYLRTDIPNQVIVTWDNVGYYDSHGSPLNSFQLVLRGSDYATTSGEGEIGFFYKTMAWEKGDVSDVPAAIGFGDGSENGQVLAGSMQSGIASTVNNRHIWFNMSDEGVPEAVNTPEPGTLALLGLGFSALAIQKLRRTRASR